MKPVLLSPGLERPARVGPMKPPDHLQGGVRNHDHSQGKRYRSRRRGRRRPRVGMPIFGNFGWQQRGGNRCRPGKGTIEVMYGLGADTEPGFKADVQKWASSNGVTVKFTKAAVVGHRDPGTRRRWQPAGRRTLPTARPDVRPRRSRRSSSPSTTPPSRRTRQTLVPGFIQAGTCADGKVYGLPNEVSVKSLLWTTPPAFKAAGFTQPKTLDQMLTLTDQIKAAGKTPWCIAAESGAATGWPITDWIEDLVLRLAGPDNYDKWVTGALKFNSPEIKPAFEYFQKIAFTDGNVRGGTKSIVATNFQTGGNALFDNPPGCYLFKQATLRGQQGWLPGRGHRQAGHRDPAVRVPAKTEGDNSVLVAGDIAAAFNNDANTLKLRNFIASKENGTEQAKAGSFSPHKTADVTSAAQQDTAEDRHRGAVQGHGGAVRRV